MCALRKAAHRGSSFGRLFGLRLGLRELRMVQRCNKRHRQLIQSTRDVPFAGKVGRGDLCKIVAPGLAPAYGRRLSEKMRK
jgi:hypothetical protein